MLGWGKGELLLLSSDGDDPRNRFRAVRREMSRILEKRRRALFLPFAAVRQSWDDYFEDVSISLRCTGLELVNAEAIEPESVASFDVFVVGGGNTFALLKESRARGLLDCIAARVRDGGSYIGWSAGSNLACPTIQTTNDMPIVEVGDMRSLGLINIQLNAHYSNYVPDGYLGENRDDRLTEYTVVHPAHTILALPECDWIATFGDAAIDDSQVVLGGGASAKLFHGGSVDVIETNTRIRAR